MIQRIVSLFVVVLVALLGATGSGGRAQYERAHGWEGDVRTAPPGFPAQVNGVHWLARSFATKPVDRQLRELGSSALLQSSGYCRDSSTPRSTAIDRAVCDGGTQASRLVHRATGPPDKG